jgi:DNA-binding response OmpR family regulator
MAPPIQTLSTTTTVLVVEDDLEINELLGEYLSLENIRYLQATTGQGGIHQAMTQHPDAIVLDLMLPDIDGFEVARTLTSRRATYDIPIIILSCMCQECDREKGFGAGALFYMNKPFLPDDLLATLRQALDWKASLSSRVPAGTIALGTGELVACAKTLNQMTADLYARTDLSDAVVGQIREAVDTLGGWARQWNKEHSEQSTLKLDYRISPGGSGPGGASVEWELTEDVPGLLADAFFKPAAAGGGLKAWAGGSLMSKPVAPIAPPSQWLQVLAKTGAAKFEKDSKHKAVRFGRSAVGGGVNGVPAGTPAGGGTVPVVEIDGMRYPTRLRDEALAAKRK